MKKSAVISACQKYRYRLDRQWDPHMPKLAFLMLNPSTADADLDDPTIRRCISFAKDWGYGGIVVGNLFAMRATNPKELRIPGQDPIGCDNDRHLMEIVRECQLVVCAWGVNGLMGGRDRQVLSLLHEYPLYALKVTQTGHPSHPLYLKKELKPIEWRG